MLLAASYAGIGFGNAGVHLPHGMSYPVSGMIKMINDFRMEGYPTEHPLVPHGISVILNAPAVFRYTAQACPETSSSSCRSTWGRYFKCLTRFCGRGSCKLYYKFHAGTWCPQWAGSTRVRETEYSRTSTGNSPSTPCYEVVTSSGIRARPCRYVRRGLGCLVAPAGPSG